LPAYREGKAMSAGVFFIQGDGDLGMVGPEGCLEVG